MNAVVVVAATLLVSCGMEHLPPQINEWHGIEGRSYPGAPYLILLGGGEHSIVDDLPARLSIVTWPEYDAVPSEVTTAPHPRRDSIGPLVWVTPREPLADRWYAIRWSGETHPYTRLDGIPLTDGSRVWRFHGRYVPEFTELVHHSGVLGVFAIEGVDDLNAIVPACDTPAPALIVSQGSETWTVDCGPAAGAPLLPEPSGFDGGQPFRLQVLPDTVETADGLSFQAIDLVVESATAGLVDLPPARNPPLVPTALCAGVACE